MRQTGTRKQPGNILLVSGCLVAITFLCLYHFPAASNPQGFVPVGYDTAYHSVRIRELIATGRLIQFDQQMHAPYGSYIPWPWTYDWVLSQVERVGRAIGIEPFRTITFLPVCFGVVNLLLLHLITRSLNIKFSGRVLVLVGFATSFWMQSTHLPGRYDHHFAELTAWLLALLSALRAHGTDRPRDAALLGGVLGAAQGIHNGLFLLQLPVAIFAGLQLLKGRPTDRAMALAFSTALLAVTIGLLLPSLPFKHLRYNFFELSWFHLFAACMTMLVVLGSAAPRGRLGFVISVPMLAVAGIGAQLGGGLRWMSGELIGLERVGETRSMLEFLVDAGFVRFLEIYGLWVLLVPPAITILAAKWRLRKPGTGAVWGYAGLALLLGVYQIRYAYLLVPAGLLLLALCLQGGGTSKPVQKIFVVLVLTSTIWLSKDQLLAAIPEAHGSRYYRIATDLAPTLARHCSRHPGTILAHKEYGHYLRYYADCPVIANNFVVAPLHENRIALVRTLFDGPPEATLAMHWIRYILVEPQSEPVAGSLRSVLMSDAVPGHFRMLAELRETSSDAVVARLFEVRSRALLLAKLRPTHESDR